MLPMTAPCSAVPSAAQMALARFRGLRRALVGPRETLATQARRRRERAEIRGRGDVATEVDAWRRRWQPAPRPAADARFIATKHATLSDVVDRAASIHRSLTDMVVELGERFRAEQDPAAKTQIGNLLEDAYELQALARGHRGDIHPDHLDHLAESTLDEEYAKSAGIRSLTWTPLASRVVGWRAPSGEWLMLPYHRPGHLRPLAYRLRRVTGRGGYGQPRGARTPIYYPRATIDSGALRDPQAILVWTEGEKKALAGARLGYAVVGLPGIWNHRDTSKPKRDLVLHPWIIEDVRIAGRVHVIAFDPSLEANPQVRLAARRLAGMLYSAGAAEVRLVRWPSVPQSVDGIDDMARVQGDQAVRDLIDGARFIAAGGVFVPMGILARRDLTATQKIAYGTLFGAADEGRVFRHSHARLGAVAGKGREAFRQLVEKLEARGFIDRFQGRPHYHNGRFYRTPDAYEFADNHAGEDAVRVTDLDLRDSAALAVAVLRRCGGMSTAKLARITGMSDRTLREALGTAEDRVRRSRGYAEPSQLESRRISGTNRDGGR